MSTPPSLSIASCRPLPLVSAEPKQLSCIDGLLFDLDDTLLDHGSLTLQAYNALWSMAEAGLRLIGVTGRPLGWAEVLVRQWPVEAMVAENGAVAVVRREGRVIRWDPAGAERESRRATLGAMVTRLRQEYPSLKDADDVSARWTDHTFDIGEHEVVPEGVVKAAAATAASWGLHSVRSSIHLHLSADQHDKATGTLAMLSAHFGYDPTSALRQWAYVGDSDNDSPCFAAFALSIGVANWRGRPSVAPRLITRAARSAGFAELAEALVAAREARNSKS